MAELTLDTGDIAAALRSNLEGWSPSLESETMGYVLSVGDGVARVAGLPGAMASELLEFPGGLLGVALNLDEDSIGTVILGDASGIEEGNEVRSTGRVLSIPTWAVVAYGVAAALFVLEWVFLFVSGLAVSDDDLSRIVSELEAIDAPTKEGE